MSSLRCREYPQLVGKKVRRVQWSNDFDGYSLKIDFEDETQVTFNLNLNVGEEVELCNLRDGGLPVPRVLVPLLVRAKVKPLEGE